MRQQGFSESVQEECAQLDKPTETSYAFCAPHTGLMTSPSSDSRRNAKADYENGNRTFQKLFTRWMDTNEWSHPVMTKLAKAALGDVSWLHSSQISSFRHNKLVAPGPKPFVAIERLNFYLHRYASTGKPIPNTNSSDYQKAFAITEDGEPPALGWWVEVFSGVRKPKDIELGEDWFSDPEANELSTKWGVLLRKLFRDQDRDIVVDLDRVLREHYPARDEARLDRIQAVIQARETWTGEELVIELPAISALTKALGGPSSEEKLLEKLREKD